MAIEPTQTLNAFADMVARQGGGLIFYQNRVFPVNSSEFITAARKVDGYHPFTVSIYNSSTSTDAVSLTLLVNPSDITIGNVAITSNSYTREGWVSTIWGNQQTTIAGSGDTAGFYIPEAGLTNKDRRSSLAFIDFQTLIAMFKNNGYYFLTAPSDQSLWKDGFSRVINVMDSIKIDYDGTTYIGSFSTFSVDDSAENPYKMTYNFEFVVSAFNDDTIEGHVRKNGNEYSSRVVLDIQGQDTSFSRTARMDTSELNENFRYDRVPRERVHESYMNLTGPAIRDRSRVDVYKPYIARNLPKIAYEDLPESTRSAVRSKANSLNLTEEQLAGFLTHESAATWDTRVQAETSTAQGIGQWTEGTVIDMVAYMKKNKLLPQSSNIRTPSQLVQEFNTIEKQLGLIDVYIDMRQVKGRSLRDRINEAPPEERLEVMLVGWFYPDYVLEPRDKVFPPEVLRDNPGIYTPNDYINFVNKRIRSLERRAKARTTTQDGEE